MERTKSRKCKSTYPAPYSNSWTGAGLTKKTTKKNSCKCVSTVRNTEPNYYRPDPTVPHLKYGLFSKRPFNRENSRTVSSIDPRMKEKSSIMPGTLNTDVKERKNVPKKVKRVAPNNYYKFEPIRIHPTVHKNAPNSPKGGSKEPMLVVRSIEHKDFHHLTVSASTHLDIKPRPYTYTTVSDTPYRKY